jgi:Domain of unknown function (DUF222)/HNH endonuclease
MNQSTAETVDQAEALLASVLTVTPATLLSDDEAIERLGAVERLGRLIDAARVQGAADIADRSSRLLGRDSLAWKRGCRTSQDLITRVTLISAREANRRVRLGEVTGPRRAGTAVLPPLYPAVATALSSGAVGVDTAEAITAALRAMSTRVAPDDIHTVECALVATATGTVTEETRGLPGEGMTHPADSIRIQAAIWRARFDPDGAAPGEGELEARSNIGFGRFTNGLFPLRGGVTPEFRGVLDGVLNTFLSSSAATPPAFPTAAEQAAQAEEQARIETGETIPGADTFDPAAADTRTGGEKCADILRMVLDRVARDPHTPSMGGAAPTVTVHVNAVDLIDNTGVGWVDGVEAPASLRSVRQLICAGGLQKIIFGENGEVLHLGGKERFFTTGQRKAIAARDGGCLVPDCPVPAAWCEVHHVIPWQNRGPTDIDNGVLLCWYHHHSIETSGWQIRMIRGRPQIKAPAWLDPGGRWRPANYHRARQTTRTLTTA